MKSCAKCGKIVGDSEISCPNCGCQAFHTDHGSEGYSAELFSMLAQKHPKLAFAILAILAIGAIGLIIWYVNFALA